MKLLKVCPDEWIQNDMPTFGYPSEKDRQYYIIDGGEKRTVRI